MIEEVLKIARSCNYEREHSHHVTKLALRLFDELQDLHRLTPRHRLLLQSAALLHDIGWIKGRRRHHKTARDIILESVQLPLTEEERIVVALVARYHRRALPKSTHKYFGDLSPEKKDELQKLAALLRVADALDRRHANVVQDLQCEVKSKEVTLKLKAADFADWEAAVTQKKADLFRKIFQKEFKIKRVTSRHSTFLSKNVECRDVTPFTHEK